MERLGSLKLFTSDWKGLVAFTHKNGNVWQPLLTRMETLAAFTHKNGKIWLPLLTRKKRLGSLKLFTSAWKGLVAFTHKKSEKVW